MYCKRILNNSFIKNDIKNKVVFLTAFATFLTFYESF